MILWYYNPKQYIDMFPYFSDPLVYKYRLWLYLLPYSSAITSLTDLYFWRRRVKYGLIRQQKKMFLYKVGGFDPELEKWDERPPRAPPCRINNHTVQGTRHNGLWWITVPRRTGRHNRENLIEHFSKPSTSRPRRGFHLLLETSRLRPIYISTKGTSIPYRKRASIVRTSRRINCNFQRVRQNRNPLSNAGPAVGPVN